MDIEAILFFSAAILLLIIITALNRERYLWFTNPNERVNKIISNYQKRGKVCSGIIKYPTPKDYKYFNVSQRRYDHIFEQKFYRVILCEEDETITKQLVSVKTIFLHFAIFKIINSPK